MMRLIACYVIAQVVLLPLSALYLWVVPRKVGLRFPWALHRALFCLTVPLPFALLSPLPVSAPQPIGSLSQSVERVMAPLRLPTAAVSDLPLSVQSTRPRRLPLEYGLLLPAAGVVVFATRLARQKRRERKLEETGDSRRIGRISVVVSQRVTIPFSTGLLQPRIFLPPEIAEDPRAFSMVFRHESVHIRRAHWVWTLIESLAASAFWFNPMMHLLARGGRRVRELLCDAEVCRRHSAVAYGRLLLDTAASAIGRSRVALVDSWIRRGMLKKRILFLVEKGRIKMRSITRISIVAAMLTAALLLMVALPFLPSVTAQTTQRPTPFGFSHDFPIVPFWPLSGKGQVSMIRVVKVNGGLLMSSSGTFPATPHFFPDKGADFYTIESSFVALATADGQVTVAAEEGGAPYRVTLATSSGHTVVYGNLGEVAVRTGDHVKFLQTLGTLAPESPGSAVGRLHYEVLKDGKEVEPFSESVVPGIAFPDPPNP